jgi:hypothetical protein
METYQISYCPFFLNLHSNTYLCVFIMGKKLKCAIPCDCATLCNPDNDGSYEMFYETAKYNHHIELGKQLMLEAQEHDSITEQPQSSTINGKNLTT